MPKPCSAADNAGLRALDARAIVAALADAAERWCDADFPPRVRATAAVCERLGYTLPVVEFALDRLFGGLTAAALTAAIAHELGSLDALDGPIAPDGRPPAWARGVDRVTIVSSDSTIGVAIPPLAYALCAKCAVTVKDREDALVAAFVETLGEERPELARAVDARSWTGGVGEHEGAALGDADVVVAFGAADALIAIRDRCGPEANFVPFGHRASAGYVRATDDLAAYDTIAAGAARDALLYDGDGCLSLHVLFVEAAGDALAAFSGALTAACCAAGVEFPMGVRAPRRAVASARYAEAAAFRAANGSGRVVRDTHGAWSIIVDAPHDEPPPFGAGAIPLVLVANADAAAAYVERHGIRLQALATTDPAGDARDLAVRLGAVRTAPFGRLQDPPLAGHHGGRSRIADFIRWIDLA
jgi:hypothetical protein